MHTDTIRDFTDKDTYAKLLIETIVKNKHWDKYKKEFGGTYFSTDFGLLFIYKGFDLSLNVGYLTYRYITVNTVDVWDSVMILKEVLNEISKRSKSICCS